MHAARSGCVPILSAPVRTPSTISWGTRCLKDRRRFASSWEREMRIHLEPVSTTVFLGVVLVTTGLAVSHWLGLAAAVVMSGIGTAIRVRSEEKLLRGAFGAEFDAYAR